MAAGRDGRRVISLSMVKNEQDIVEPFIRHHARLVDCMVVIDNASVDATRAVAVACARELRHVVVLDSPVFAHTQGEQMTRLLHRAQSAFGADYVLLLDADEFVGVADRAALLVELERIVPGGVGYWGWRTFVRDDEETADPPRSFRWRRREERPAYRKAVLRLAGADAGSLRVEQGNHDVTGPDGGRLEGIRLDAPLLHFPVRSQDQLATKGVVGWMANVAADPRAREGRTAFQWRDAFDRVVASDGGLDLREASLRYAQEPVDIDWERDVVEEPGPWDYVRRYSDGRFEAALSMVARSWERSLAPPREASGWVRLLADRYGPGLLVEIGDGSAAAAWRKETGGEALVLDPKEAAVPGLASLVVCSGEITVAMVPGWETDAIGVLGLRCVADEDGPELVLRRSRTADGDALPAPSWWRRLIGGSR